MRFLELTVPTEDKIYVNIFEIVWIRPYNGNANTIITLTTGEPIGVLEDYESIRDKIEFRMEKLWQQNR